MRDFTIPDDTTPDAHRVQAEIYARMGGTARVATAFQLAETVRRLSFAGIRRRHPDYSDQDVLLAWARLTLGDALTRRVWPDRELPEP